ncbi:forms aploid and binucleate cells 3 [Striga asiatica]|uniref:Forms aploid and binucleate cells 3 n=1 Tax=Striga asiatica TaxID=4170 RepID=A0A5A7QAW4_STRAF|nr:forms aploid and binucleate cells 3 [Striga asiatica]
MGSSRALLHLIFFFLVLCSTSSSYISNEVLEPHGSIGRSILQQKSTCPVDFENMNYTVITSQCKGPNYTPERCCNPLKELVCPIKDQFNDLKTNCADTFFSYINLYGKYPPGLFAALCKEGEKGLDCSNVPDQPSRSTPNQSGALSSSAYSITMAMVFVILLIMM